MAAGGHLHRPPLTVDQNLQVHEFVGGHVVGEDERLLAVFRRAHQLGGPDQGVEDRVVLPDKVYEPALGLLPVLPPPVGLPDVLGPLHGRGDVADAGVEPHVEAFVLEAGLGDGDPPLDVPRYGPLLQAAVYDAEDEVLDRGAPVLLSSDVLPQPLGELGEVEVEVRSLPDLDRSARYLGVRLDELVRFVPRAAVVTLVAPRLFVAAHGAGPLYVTVGQKTALRRAVHLLGLGLRDVAAF